MIKNLILIAVFLILGVFYFRYIELRSIFYPMRNIETTPRSVGLDYEEIYCPTEDGISLNGWLVKSPGAKSTLLFFHGNAGNISHRLDKIALFYKLGINTFIIDYRGYGKSEGRPSEEGIYRDGRAAYDYLSRRLDLGAKKIAYGESLGCAVAVDLGLHRQLDGIILDSAFSSAKDMAKVVFPFVPPFLLVSQFDSLQKVKDLPAPKLFIHSVNDEIVPISQGEKLFNAAGEPKEFLQITGGHNSGFFVSQELIREKLKTFLDKFHLL